jgi:hypothetical protein
VTGLPRQAKPIETTAVGATPALAEQGPFRLHARLDRLGGDDRAVWRAVLADPGYVLVDQYLGETGAGPTAITYRPGDTLTVTDPRTGRATRKTIAGILADDTAFDGIGEHSFGSPLVMAADGLREQFGSGARATAALLRTAPGVADEALAADLQGEFLPQGWSPPASGTWSSRTSPPTAPSSGCCRASSRSAWSWASPASAWSWSGPSASAAGPSGCCGRWASRPGWCGGRS